MAHRRTPPELSQRTECLEPDNDSDRDSGVGDDAGSERLQLQHVEPWNSVRVTFNIPRDAAERLRLLAQNNQQQLRDLGILSVQIEGGVRMANPQMVPPGPGMAGQAMVCQFSSNSSFSINRRVPMGQVQYLPRLLITCRLCRLGDNSTLQHCSSYSNSITNSNRPNSKLSSPSLALDLHSTHQVKWLLAGTRCPLSSHKQLREALPGGSPHPKPRWFNDHLPLLPYRHPATPTSLPIWKPTGWAGI
ncbi:hypothetical protein INR49_009106 [Caranx melampygus]|nr:hypothetical protein INR49_009106 [Caranx melampygus]